MIQNILRYAIPSLMLVLLVSSPFSLSTVNAQTPRDEVCRGVGLAGGTADCSEPEGGPSVDSTIKLVVSILSFIVGVAAVIMIIIGGFKYITSSGDSNNIQSAKNTILYAIVGLVVAVLAQVLVRFVINQATTDSSGGESGVVRLV